MVRRGWAPAALALLLAACSGGHRAPAGVAAAPAPRAPLPGAIDAARLARGDAEPEQWLTPGGGWRGTHHSALADINPATLARLGFAWEFATGTRRGLEATPVAVDGVLYTSGVAGRVYALDAATGALRWRFEPRVDLQVVRGTCCDEVNRGVAVWRGRVYVASLDGWLYCLDAADGKPLWKVDTIADRTRAYSSTGAPLIAGDAVVIGNAGGEYDVRGYVTAYELATGAQRWRFFTVPGAAAGDAPASASTAAAQPELAAAARTWDAHSDLRYGGGGPVWDGLAYDPALDLLYVGTGNAETYPQRVRSPGGGDNLYTSSILAIAPKTGRLVWHYQETPGDQWDFDSDAPMVLVDRKIDGVPRRLLLHAPKNGLFYVLDRSDGKFVSAGKFATANWTSGVDASGRPSVDRTAADYGGGAKLVFPSVIGAHSWAPMAYGAATGLVYLPTAEMGNILYDVSGSLGYRPSLFNANVGVVLSGFIDFLKDTLPPAVRRDLDSGRLLAGAPPLRMRSSLQAWDPIAQKVVWRSADGDWWDHAGVLATAGGLVVQGSDRGVLRFYDAVSGKLLRSIETGSSIIAAPAMYRVGGETFLVVLAAWGGGGWAVAHPESAAYQRGNAGRILAFKLGGGAVPLPPLLPADPPVPKPPARPADAATLARGAMLFGTNCAICHPNQTRSGSADLRRMSAGIHAAFNDIVLNGLKRDAGMPGWGDVLSAADADAIHAYLVGVAAQAYAAQEKSRRSGAAAGAETGIVKGY
jgi:quinohemoprotein ethanol dehydrogenase